MRSLSIRPSDAGFLMPVRGHLLPHGRPPIDERLVLDELKDLASRVALFIFTVHMHVEPAHAAL